MKLEKPYIENGKKKEKLEKEKALRAPSMSMSIKSIRRAWYKL